MFALRKLVPIRYAVYGTLIKDYGPYPAGTKVYVGVDPNVGDFSMMAYADHLAQDPLSDLEKKRYPAADRAAVFTQLTIVPGDFYMTYLDKRGERAVAQVPAASPAYVQQFFSEMPLPIPVLTGEPARSWALLAI